MDPDPIPFRDFSEVPMQHLFDSVWAQQIFSPRSATITLNKPPFIMETPTNPDAPTASFNLELAQSILHEMTDVLDAHYNKRSDLPSTLVAVANLLAAITSIFKDNIADVRINGKPVPLDHECMTLHSLKQAGLKYDLDFGKWLKFDE